MTPGFVRLVLAAALTGAAGLVWGLDAHEQVQFADGLYARGMWDVALKEYETALKQSTNQLTEAMIRYRMGECQLSLGRTNEAESCYVRVGTLPEGGEYRVRAGMRRVELLEAQGRMTDAAELAVGLMRASPTGDLAAACQYLVGTLQERVGRTNDAAQAYEALLRGSGGAPFASFAALALGSIVAHQEPGSSRAADLYAYAATNAPGPRVAAEAWYLLGEWRFRHRQFEESAAAYERLLSLYPNDERAAEARMRMAWATQNAGRYAAAIAMCNEALKAQPVARETDWLYLKANGERQLAQNDAALATYTTVLQRSPTGEVAAAAGYERALVLFRLGRHADAIRQIRSQPIDPRVEKDAFWLLAECSVALNDEATAVANYRLIAEKYPRSDMAPDAAYRLASLLQKQGQLVPAAETFVRLADRYPTNALAPQALFAAGICRSKAGAPETALQDWVRLLAAYPDSRFAEEALYQKGAAETYLKRDEAALATWRDLVHRYPASRFLADAQFWSGVLLEAGGKLEDAEVALRAALKAGPAGELEQRARYRLALVLQRRNQADESAALLQALLAAPATNAYAPDVLEWLTDYQLQKKDYPKAVEASGRLVQQADTPAWQQIALCLNGKALQGVGRFDDARQAFEKAVAVPVKTQAATDGWLRLGELALRGTNYAAAKAAFDKAVDMSAGDAQIALRVQAYVGLARTFKAQGDDEGAARHFLSVGVLFDDPVLVPECLHEAAEAYARLGRTDESAKVVHDLLARYPDSEWAKRYKTP